MNPAGYSGTPLIKKLGFEEGQRVHFVNAPPELPKLIGPLPEAVVELATLKKPLDLVMLFVTAQSDFKKRLPKLITALAPTGMIWVCWPKKAAKVETDVTENVIRDYALTAGVVDVKVCAVSEIWSGLKLVIRLKDR